ncbi:hypothetical protein E1301_Tti016842 [Triplophysa tibetana]|uniref:C2H2-type domain-containing protein n=1 Tax=Triplophysa tibetana TaxID=1572043 RepID=A0A5A9NBA4_9TELE|nr:hypothetical protein E1301_Tti016842 [Triplophysa tibetana]
MAGDVLNAAYISKPEAVSPDALLHFCTQWASVKDSNRVGRTFVTCSLQRPVGHSDTLPNIALKSIHFSVTRTHSKMLNEENDELNEVEEKHLGQTPQNLMAFTCPQCEKCFKRKSHFEEHTRVHTGERPYTCPQCEMCFKRRCHFVEHMKVHTGSRPFTCTLCGNSFRRRSHFDDHMRIHTGERPYTCPQCEKTFTQKTSLEMHMRIHTGERPYTCPQCEKRFQTQKSS